jgi:hypothetical protein
MRGELNNNQALRMPQESIELDPDETEWLESVAKMYGLPVQVAAETLLQAAIEQRRDKPEDEQP